MNPETALKILEGDTLDELRFSKRQAVKSLAAEVRRLTVLRPMESAPDATCLLEEKYSGEMVIGAHHSGRVYTQAGGSFGADYFKGWLPLPTPTSAEG